MLKHTHIHTTGLTWWLSVKESTCQCRKQARSLVQRHLTCCGAAKPTSHNHWACALEPRSNEARHHNEKPATGEQPPLCTITKSPYSNDNPAQPEINKQTFKHTHTNEAKWDNAPPPIRTMICPWNIYSHISLILSLQNFYKRGMGSSSFY